MDGVAQVDVPAHAEHVYQREPYFSNRSAICTAFRAAPFEQLVAGAEQRDRLAAGVAQILADAADQDVVLARRVLRHREVVAGHVVDDLHARRRRENLAHFIRRDRPLALERERHAMCAQNRHAHARGGNRRGSARRRSCALRR